MTDEPTRRAIANWAKAIAEGLEAQADAYRTLADFFANDKPQWNKAADLPAADRPQRQALLLGALQEWASAHGTEIIPKTEMLALAAHFGYDPRGTAGFFRRSPDGSEGLLKRDGDGVRLADAGRRRIGEFQGTEDYTMAILQAVEAAHDLLAKPRANSDEVGQAAPAGLPHH